MRDRGEKRKIHEMPTSAEPARAMRMTYFKPLKRPAASKLFSPLDFPLLPWTQSRSQQWRPWTDVPAKDAARKRPTPGTLRPTLLSG